MAFPQHNSLKEKEKRLDSHTFSNNVISLFAGFHGNGGTETKIARCQNGARWT